MRAKPVPWKLQLVRYPCQPEPRQVGPFGLWHFLTPTGWQRTVRVRSPSSSLPTFPGLAKYSTHLKSLWGKWFRLGCQWLCHIATRSEMNKTVRPLSCQTWPSEKVSWIVVFSASGNGMPKALLLLSTSPANVANHPENKEGYRFCSDWRKKSASDQQTSLATKNNDFISPRFRRQK